MTLAALRARLLDVSRSGFTAHDHLNDPAPLNEGTGVVRTSETEEGAIEWDESGEWGVGVERTAYWNRLRWKVEGEELQLHHLRRGREAPVHLISLFVSDEGALLTKAPHRCGADDYRAAVTLTPDAITISWDVRGPMKKYSLRAVYR